MVDEVSREVKTRMLETGEARALTISRVYHTFLEDMWEIVTLPERLERWFLPVSLSGDEYQLQGNAGGRITACEKPHSYDATWEYGSSVSWIEVRLTPEGPDRTRFTLTHIAHVDEHWEQFGPGAAGIGWDLGLHGLAIHVAEPSAALDAAAVEAWTLSPDGRLFLEQSSDAWAEADIAAGEGQAQAHRRAAATYAFYTGT